MGRHSDRSLQTEGLDVLQICRLIVLLLACLTQALAQTELGLSPQEQPLFNPTPIEPAPSSVYDAEKLTNLINQAKAEQEQSSPPKTVFDTTMWKAFIIAEEAAAKGNWEKSDLILLKMHKLIPSNIMLAEKAATIYGMREAHGAAREIWLQEFARNPERYELLTEIGKCSLFMEEYEQAEKALKIAKKFSLQPLEPRFYYACVFVKRSQPDRIPDALDQLTLFDMSILCYWLGSEFGRYEAFLGETGYLQLASYILGGGEEGSLEIRNIEKVSNQLLETSRILNKLDRHLAQNRHEPLSDLLKQAFDRGVRGLSYEIYTHIVEAIQGDHVKAKAGLLALATQHPDRALVQHYHGTALMLMKEYTAAVKAFKNASAITEDPRIEFDLIEAIASTGDTEAAFDRLKIFYYRHPKHCLDMLNKDSDGLRSLKKHPDYGSWHQALAK